jgi:outer membrane biosynthesis protein TonB
MIKKALSLIIIGFVFAGYAFSAESATNGEVKGDKDAPVNEAEDSKPSEHPTKAEHPEHPTKKGEHTEHAEHPEKSEHPEKAEKAEKSEHPSSEHPN